MNHWLVKIFSITLTLLLTGCLNTKKFNKLKDVTQPHDIQSTRPQNAPYFFAIVKLSTPALLSKSATKLIDSDKKIVIDEELKKEILAEQEEYINELKKLSDKIRIIYRYRLVLNGLGLMVPMDLKDQIKTINGQVYIEESTTIGRPQVLSHLRSDDSTDGLTEQTSVKFTHALEVHEKIKVLAKDGSLIPLKGQGITVGVIDTGIDFTHSMLGGSGNLKDYESVDPNLPSPHFPNKKVIGGIDLVGSEYNASSLNPEQRIPHPDSNPMDEGGHGTHVAGTVAGIGDNKNTYSGMAPEALLYAIKLFGKAGSTSTMSIIAAFEYSVDPNQDLDPSDKIDVLNLSLGSDFGHPHILDREAVENTIKAGVSVICAAGNAGHYNHIVGSPSTIKESVSVAASIDNMSHNWKFQTVKFETSNGKSYLAESIEATFTPPLKDFDTLSGKLYHIGLGNTELTVEDKNNLKGNVALIDRGAIRFSQKVKKAKSGGAIAAVIINNVEGEPIMMGGDEKIDIPAIMITKSLGTLVKEAMKSGTAHINFKSKDLIEKPHLIDTLTSFSSKGPRLGDALIKPELAAPGSAIISAKLGGGNAGEKMSGTSMASPHVAGAMALLTQLYPKLSPLQLKSLIMTSSERIMDKDKKEYPVAQQGAGRINIFEATQTPLVFDEASLSLGEILVGHKKLIRKNITLTNITEKALKITLDHNTHLKETLELNYPQSLEIPAKESRTIQISALISATGKESHIQVDGFLNFKIKGKKVAHLPFLAIINKVSHIVATNPKVYASTMEDSSYAAVDLELKNQGLNPGEALIFNLIGKDPRETFPGKNYVYRNTACDLESAGYRMVSRQEEDGKARHYLQFAVKLYRPVSSWQGCEVSILFDNNGDKIAEQELVGILHENFPGLQGIYYSSLLLDAPMARELRKKYEEMSQTEEEFTVNYTEAIIMGWPFQTYNYSTISVLEVDIDNLAFDLRGKLHFKLGILNNNENAITADDFLEKNSLKKWHETGIESIDMSYIDIPEKILLAPGETKTVPLMKGEGKTSMIVYFPHNRTTKSHSLKDGQSAILKEEYAF